MATCWRRRDDERVSEAHMMRKEKIREMVEAVMLQQGSLARGVIILLYIWIFQMYA